MAAIISWQFMGWPDLWSTLAAASRALSFLSWGAAFFALGAAFSTLGVPGVFRGFLADGVAAPSNPLSLSVESRTIGVFLDDGENLGFAEVSFAGLAPGFAGLYQVNFKLPESGLKNGDVHIALETNEAENEMATINLSGFTEVSPFSISSGRASQRLRRAGLRNVAGRHDKSVRRALPEMSR